MQGESFPVLSDFLRLIIENKDWRMQTNATVARISPPANRWSAVFTARRLAPVALARLAVQPGILRGIALQTLPPQSANLVAGSDATVIVPTAALFKAISTLPVA